MTYRYTYKITCLKGSLLNHYYYGQHTTEDLDDGYYGSGKKLQCYYKKYGAIENVTYTKDIIEFYNTQEELNIAEYKLIGDKYETDSMCLNLIAGGNVRTPSDETRQKLKEKRKGRKPSLGHPCSEEHKQKIRKKNLGHPNYMHHQTDEAKQKISEKNKGNKNLLGYHHTEEKKKQIGETLKNKHLVWIHLGDNAKKVEYEYVFYWLDDGWKLGRKDKNIIKK